MTIPVQTLGSTVSRTSDVAAFFDLDNTLIPGSAIELRFFRYLWRQGLVGWTEASASLRLLLRHGPSLSLHPLRERKLYLTGKSVSVIEPLAREFVATEVIPRLSSEGLRTVEAHRRAGHHRVLITGSLDFLVEPLATHLHLEMEAVLAAKPEQVGGRYTGYLLSPVPYGEEKRRLVLAFSERQGIDLACCYAYGDSPGDAAVLASVGHPQVVNPIRGMERIARRAGWRIETWK